MSTASYVGTVKFSKRMGVYMPLIVSDKGDLYQEYQGTANAPVDIAPSFGELAPTLSFVLTSSRVAEGVVVPKSVAWYFNDVLLAFTGNVSTNTLGGEAGHFKNVPYSAGVNNYYGLQIVKDLVKASGAASCVIRAEATVVIGNTEDVIQATYNIPITKGVGNQVRVTIGAGDNKAFTIRDKGDSCKLTAMARQGKDEITSGLTYQWYQSVSGIWSNMGLTTKTIDVTESMVATSAVMMVEVYQNGELIGSDTQSVFDVSDPYDILPNPTPADETIMDSGDTVTYSPQLVKRGDPNNPITEGVTFTMMFYDSAGNQLGTGMTCTYGMCDQAGSDVNYVIEATLTV